MFTSRFRWSFFSTGYVAFYTGFLLIFFMTKPADFYPNLRHLLVKSHIISVMLWLFTCGMLFSIHVFPQLQAGTRAGRRSGISLVILLIAMTFSGYALQVLPWQNLLAGTRWVHVITGSGFALMLIGHLLLIKAEIRKWLIAAVAAGILLSLPFFTLQPTETFPDEIRLTPQSDAGQKKKSVTRNLPTMGTLFSAELSCSDVTLCTSGFDAIRPVLDGIDNRMSVYHSSELTRINAAAGTASLLQPVSADTLEVLRTALVIAAQSEGRFDPTILPLIKAYGLMREDFGGEAETARTQLAAAADLVDYRQVLISGARAGLKKKGMALDFGGIAKGYALDQASAALQKLGINSFVLNFGGHLLVHGTKHTTTVYDPRELNRVLASCTISEGSISVSAQDKRFVTERGKSRGHLINPLTKQSENETLLSLVYHPSAMHADAWSTALFFTGVAEFSALSQKQKLAAVHLSSRGELSVSEQMKKLKLCTVL